MKQTGLIFLANSKAVAAKEEKKNLFLCVKNKEERRDESEKRASQLFSC